MFFACLLLCIILSLRCGWLLLVSRSLEEVRLVFFLLRNELKSVFGIMYVKTMMMMMMVNCLLSASTFNRIGGVRIGT